MIGLKVNQLRLLLNENWKMINHLLVVNENAINNYFREIEIEIISGGE